MGRWTDRSRPRLVLALVVAGTVLGLMGTDLVLPAVPSLPEALGGDATQAQFVLAAYAAGTCFGLLAYGALGDRASTRSLFAGSLLGTAGVSVACAAASNVVGVLWIKADLQAALATVDEHRTVLNGAGLDDGRYLLSLSEGADAAHAVAGDPFRIIRTQHRGQLAPQAVVRRLILTS